MRCPAPQARLVLRCSGTLRGFISVEAHIVGEKPEDLTVLDEGIGGNAKSTGDELLTTLTQALRLLDRICSTRTAKTRCGVTPGVSRATKTSLR